MAGDVAVVDASVIILVATPSKHGEPEDLALRRDRATESLVELRDSGARFVVPAPAIVELMRDEDGEKVASKVLARLGGLRVEDLDLVAAKHAGLALRRTLKAGRPGEGRNAIKFDALISGIAHRLKAKFLVTANARDFERHLREMSSDVEVLDVAAPRKKGQLRLIDRQP